MPRSVHNLSRETQTGALPRLMILHVSPAKTAARHPKASTVTIEGNVTGRSRWTLGSRALLLVALGSASWVACAMTVTLVRRIIA